MKKIVLFGGVALCFLLGVQRGMAASSCTSTTGNLVTNCGFETGSFSGWTLSGNDVPSQLNNQYGVETGTDPDGNAPHGGVDQAYFGDQVANSTTLAQSIATIAGTTYSLSFWVAQDGPLGPNSNKVVVSFGGVTLATLTGIPVEGYTQFTYTGLATSSSSSLSLSLGNQTGFFLVDDVTVTVAATPEPSSMLLLSTGLAGLSWVKRRRLFA